MTLDQPSSKVSITTRTGFTVTLATEGRMPPPEEDFMSDLLTAVYAVYGMFYADAQDTLLDITESLHEQRLAERAVPSEFDQGFTLGLKSKGEPVVVSESPASTDV